jgi:hypothetical protein
MESTSTHLAMTVDSQISREQTKDNIYPGVNSFGELKSANPTNFLQCMSAINNHIKGLNLSINLADTHFTRIPKKSNSNKVVSEPDHAKTFYNEYRNGEFSRFMQDETNFHHNNRSILYMKLGIKIHKEHLEDLNATDKLRAEQFNDSSKIKNQTGEKLLLESDPVAVQYWLKKFDSVYKNLARIDPDEHIDTLEEITDLDIINKRLDKLGLTSKVKSEYEKRKSVIQKQSHQYEAKVKDLTKLFTVVIHTSILTTETKQLAENHEFAAAWKAFIHNELINKDYTDVLLLITCQILLTKYDTDIHKSFEEYYNNLTSLFTVYLLRTHPDINLPYDKLTEIVDTMSDTQAETALKTAGINGNAIVLPDLLKSEMRHRILIRGLQRSNLQTQVDLLQQTQPNASLKEVKDSLDRYDRQHASGRSSAKIDGVMNAIISDRNCEACTTLHREESACNVHSATTPCPSQNQERIKTLARDAKSRNNIQQDRDRSQMPSYRYALMTVPPNGPPPSRGNWKQTGDQAPTLSIGRPPSRQDRHVVVEEKHCTHCQRAADHGNLKRGAIAHTHFSHDCRVKLDNIEKRNNPRGTYSTGSTKRPREQTTSTQQQMAKDGQWETLPPYQHGQQYPYANGYYNPYEREDYFRVGQQYPGQQQHPLFQQPNFAYQQQPMYGTQFFHPQDRPSGRDRGTLRSPPADEGRSSSRERRQKKGGGSQTSTSRSRSRSASREKKR